MDKKIAIILGRGVEGCGVTKNAIEFNKFYKNSCIFATVDKIWGRHNSMKFEYVGFKCSDLQSVNDLIHNINSNFDIVIFYSIPSIKHETSCIKNFLHLIDSIKLPKTMIQVDHNNASLQRNANLIEVCNMMDQLLTHSLNGAFANWCYSNSIQTPLNTMGVGFNYDLHRSIWWKPIEEQDDRHIKWIGRCAVWKGPVELINFHNECLRKHSFITTLEGLEASLASTIITHINGDKEKPRDVNEYIRSGRHKLAHNLYGKEKYGDAPWLYPSYINLECMERLSRCAFGSDLYNLKKEYYGNNIEYCHAEVIASGAVPIFHKHFGDNVIHRKTGIPCTKTFSGTIWYDPNNLEYTTKYILKLAKDRVARDEWRETAYEFWKEHSDASIINNDILQKSLSATPNIRNRSFGIERFI